MTWLGCGEAEPQEAALCCVEQADDDGEVDDRVVSRVRSMAARIVVWGPKVCAAWMMEGTSNTQGSRAGLKREDSDVTVFDWCRGRAYEWL